MRQVNAFLDSRSIQIREDILRMMARGGRGHLASALSLVEILRVLYDDILNFRPEEPRWSDRDRLILSKGHGCMALYALLADKGFFDQAEFQKFCQADGILGGHPEANKVPGVEASTGALGHGLSIGVGMAVHAKLEGRRHHVLVILGDGECNEGSVWEAAMSAAKHRLDNLAAIIDCNKMQSYSTTFEVMDLEPLSEKWRSFGFEVREADGHDVEELRRTFQALPFAHRKPSAIICHTMKGKGIPGVENNLSWHHKSKLSQEEITILFSKLRSQP
ncbi:MAG: transketolase [Planctomycetes bacterium]|nr:transketolase [Planctomycetota bacterium]